MLLTPASPASATEPPPDRRPVPFDTALKRLVNAPIFGHEGSRAAWIVTTIGAIVIAVIWVAVISRLNEERETVLWRASHRAEATAQYFEQRTLRRLKEADVTTRLLKYLFERDGRVDVRDALARGLIAPNAYQIISIVDADGHVTASSEPRAVGIMVADRDYFQRHATRDTNQLDISAPVKLRVLPNSALQLTRRLNDAHGRFAGIVVLSVDPDFFVDFYRASELGSNGALGLVGSADGVYRARRTGRGQASAPAVTGTPVSARAKREPMGTFESASPFDGVHRIVSYRTLAEFPLIVVASVSREEVLAEYNQRRSIYLGSAIVVSGILLVCFSIVTALAVLVQRSRRRAWKQATQLKLVSHVFETTADAIVISDPDDRIIMVNAAFTTMTGFAPSEMLGLRLAESPFAPLDPEASAARMQRQIREGHITAEVSRVRKDGTPLSLWVTASCVHDDQLRITHYIRVFTDISVLKETQHKLETLATIDPLTMLPNRRAFHERVAQALERARRRTTHCALLFVDLDGFKQVNDRLGHDAGDRLLGDVAKLLQGTLRASDCAFRVGGDEFAILLEDVKALNEASAVAERVIVGVNRIPITGPQLIPVGASIGIAMFPADGDDLESLLKNADAAMYRVKTDGRNGFRFCEAARPVAARRDAETISS